jgi:hypothetical protein
MNKYLKEDASPLTRSVTSGVRNITKDKITLCCKGGRHDKNGNTLGYTQ